jgi:hypothetical protein
MLSPLGHLARSLGASLAFSALLLSPSFALQEKVTLSMKGDVGSTTKFKTTSKMEISAEGEKILFESVENLEIKLAKKEGDRLVFESKVVSSEVSINGEKMEDEEEEESPGAEYSVKPNGELASFKDKDPEADKESTSLSLRISQASAQIYSAQPVGVGDAWSFTFPVNKDWGTFAGTANFKLVGIETVGGIRVAKIEYTYLETGAPRNIKSSGTNWVEIASGQVVKYEGKYENVPFDFGGEEEVVASVAESSERTSGGLLVASSQAKPDDKKETAADSAKKEEAKKEEAKKEEEDKNSIDVKTKGWEKMDGLFTLYRKVDGTRTRLSLEIKKSQLNTLFVLQTTLSTGSGSRVVAGNPVSDLVFEWRQMPNNKIYLTVPNFYWRAPKNPELEKVLKRSFNDAIVESFDIDGTQKDRDSILIDVSSFFTGNIGRVFDQVAGGGTGLAALMSGGGGVSPDREKTFIQELKVFPTNLFVQTFYSFSSSGRDSFDPFQIFEGEVPERSDTRSLTVVVNYNLFQLPVNNGFQPRRGDKRVGYFNVVHRDWSAPSALDQKVENILRWDLRKKDPNAALSEPVTPIVFHVDAAFPVKHRETVKKALLSWNAAFEKIGFKNAVVVHQMKDTNEFDHADMRYNVVRMVASPGDAYAIALFRANPMTGQILNASITLDANFLRAIEGDWKANSPAEAFDSVRRLVDATSEERTAHVQAHGAACTCGVQHEGAKRAAFGALSLALSDSAVDQARKEEFAADYLYHVVQHEFGHILGLRHNFVASTQLSPKELSDPEKVKKHNTTASVMDYVEFNNYALGKPDVPFFGRTLGDYDVWAVRFGYLPTGIPDPDEEAKFLKAIAAQGSKPGLEYQSDEQADGIDPYTRRFDLSADPLTRSQDIMVLSRRLLMTLGDRAPKGGESYYEFTRAFNILLSRMAGSAAEASLFIGGVRRSFAHVGDPGARKPIVPVDAATQRKALDLLLTNVLDEKAFDFPKSYYTMFTSDPKGSAMENILDSFDTYPVLDQLTGLQSSALSALMSPRLIRQLINEEWKAPAGTDVLKASELMLKVRNAVWQELDQNRAVGVVRRALQRTHVDRLIDLGVRQDSGRSEANVMAWGMLRRLADKLKAAKPADSATALHYEELGARIERALNAVQTLGGGGGSSRPISLADLLGGRKP